MAFTCPICDAVSHNSNDEKNRYCGRCHLFIGEVELYFDIQKLREAYRSGKPISIPDVELNWDSNG